MSSNDIIERLAGQNPVPPEALSTLGTSRAASITLERVLASDSEPRAGRTSLGSGPKRRRVVTAVAAIAAVVAVAAALVIVIPGSGAPANAAQLLRQASRTAGSASPAPADAIEYQAVTETTSLAYQSPEGPYTVFRDVSLQTWLAPDGSGRIVTEDGTGRVANSEQDTSRWEAAGSPAFPASSNADAFGPGMSPYYDLAGLSSDPRLLRQEMPGLIGVDTPSQLQLFKLGADLLAQPDTSPSLRAAVYSVLAGLPDITLLGPTTDPAGRQGVGVALDSGETGADMRTTLILDPDTSAILASTTTLLGGQKTIGVHPPVILDSTTYTGSGEASSLHARPSVITAT